MYKAPEKFSFFERELKETSRLIR